LQGKNIKKIEGLDSCTNLKVLYLYDNQIEQIENLEFAGIVQYVLLQNNLIEEIPHLAMPKLRKLYLDENQISFVGGLEELEVVEELHVARQRIPSFSALEFDMASLAAIGNNLQVLEISGNGIRNLRQFGVLYLLRKLFAGDNNVTDLEEIEAIIGLQHLEEAFFLGNPCCQALRYRDYAIGCSSDALKKLDDDIVQRHQQIAIRGLMRHREKCGFGMGHTDSQERNQDRGGTPGVRFEGEGSMVEGGY